MKFLCQNNYIHTLQWSGRQTINVCSYIWWKTIKQFLLICQLQNGNNVISFCFCLVMSSTFFKRRRPSIPTFSAVFCSLALAADNSSAVWKETAIAFSVSTVPLVNADFIKQSTSLTYISVEYCTDATLSVLLHSDGEWQSDDFNNGTSDILDTMPLGNPNSVQASHRTSSPYRPRMVLSFRAPGHGCTRPGPAARPSHNGIVAKWTRSLSYKYTSNR